MNRDLNPTPEAVFAMFHWPDEYCVSRLGSMGFYEALTVRQREYCADAVKAMKRAAPVSPAQQDDK